MTAPFHVMRDLIDHEIVDAEKMPCGMVDDVEMSFTEGRPEVTALLVGPGAWIERLPACLRVAARAVFGRSRVRVPVTQVERIDEAIVLRVRASELGLAVLDRKIGRAFSRGRAA